MPRGESEPVLVTRVKLLGYDSHEPRPRRPHRAVWLASTGHPCGESLQWPLVCAERIDPPASAVAVAHVRMERAVAGAVRARAN